MVDFQRRLVSADQLLLEVEEVARSRRGVQISSITTVIKDEQEETDLLLMLLLPGVGLIVTKGRRRWPDTAFLKVAGAPNFRFVVETRPIRQAEIDIIIL